MPKRIKKAPRSGALDGGQQFEGTRARDRRAAPISEAGALLRPPPFAPPPHRLRACSRSCSRARGLLPVARVSGLGDGLQRAEARRANRLPETLQASSQAGSGSLLPHAQKCAGASRIPRRAAAEAHGSEAGGQAVWLRRSNRSSRSRSRPRAAPLFAVPLLRPLHGNERRDDEHGAPAPAVRPDSRRDALRGLPGPPFERVGEHALRPASPALSCLVRRGLLRARP